MLEESLPRYKLIINNDYQAKMSASDPDAIYDDFSFLHSAFPKQISITKF